MPTPSANNPSTLSAMHRQQMKQFTTNKQALEQVPTLVIEPLNDTFDAKKLDLFEPIKIGRKLGPKAPAEAGNGIFDSKVLSRTHAEVWFDRGKVYIKDAKSSNGTFVNGVRLSEEGQESSPHELKTGDILEFGIDIMTDDGQSVLYQKVSGKIVVLVDGINPAASTAVVQPVEGDPSKMTLNRKKLDTMNKKVEAEIAAAVQTNAQLEALKSTLTNLETHALPAIPTSTPANNDNSNTEALKAAHTAEINSWTEKHTSALREIESYKAMVERSTQQVDMIKSELVDSRSRVDAFVKDVEEWKDKCKRLNEEMDIVRKERDIEKKRSEEGASDIQRLTSQNAAINQDLVQLTQERDELRALSTKSKQSMDESSLEISSLNARIKSLEVEVAHSRKLLEEARSAAAAAAAAAVSEKSRTVSKSGSGGRGVAPISSTRPAFSIFSISSWFYLGLTVSSAFLRMLGLTAKETDKEA
ncbi:hypothetical protein SmJEL517_g04914 [Synchytrium microbalum]|uniref:FHA domain-containing protein n=1 Tax=Synchytrium microbalum TaxID=1806994 RepID=A0A507BPD9_9FUNG|nr:uncharacterized protein SmJEL517_g04914 [Synchytrium microbalum]TPX31850.1 hypothetical protein SmJEL517_g04914 [Synchytrium microbalum]